MPAPIIRGPIALVGPTCSGKTKIVNALSVRLPLDLINLDSFQIFSHFRIGTGRADLMEGIRGHLYGTVDPLYPISADDYAETAIRTYSAIKQMGRIPLFEGGSVSFLRALLQRQPMSLFGVHPTSPNDTRDRIAERIRNADEAALIEEIRLGIRFGLQDSIVMNDDVVYLPYLDYVEGRSSIVTARERAVANLVARHLSQLNEYREFDITWLDAADAVETLANQLAEAS